MPLATPAQETEYHLHNAASPSNPPDKFKVEEDPLQISGAVEVAALAGVELVQTVTTRLLQTEVLHGPSALTK